MPFQLRRSKLLLPGLFPSAATLACALSLAVTAFVDTSRAQTEAHSDTRADSQYGAPSGNSPNQLQNGTASESAGVPAALIQLLSTSQYYSQYAFVVDKKERVLSVWTQSPGGLKKVASYPADLGKNSGDKRNQGDHKTPEGIYFLQNRLDGGAIDFNLYGKRAFTTDYPNYFDRAEGKTGSGIWLHAVPDHVPLTRGSSGCVVVRNDVILDLSKYVRLGRTPLLIQNQSELVPQTEVEKKSTELNAWLENWRSAWEKKDIQGYIAHYGPEFRAMKMNRDQWRDYKAHLNEQYKVISVKISKPSIFVDRDRAIVRFLQEYTSDFHSDFGEKVLYLKKGPSGYRIVGESWGEETSQVARDEIEATIHTSTHATNNGTTKATTGTNLTPDQCTSGAANCPRTNAGVQ